MNEFNNHFNLFISDLFEHVHPSLVHVACTLEFLFQLFDSVVEHLLSVHGEDIQDKEIEVESLAKVSTYLYAMTSTIARYICILAILYNLHFFL